MTKLYLITGFLGAGKTTFLNKFTQFFQDKKIVLIVNEFGKNGVDGALLQHIGARLAEIDNGSIFCACRIEQFEEAVTTMLEYRPDYIFVEASGLADPTAVRSIFSQDICSQLEYAGAICIVDAVRFHKVYETARVCRMQLAISDLVLINKTDIASKDQIEEIKQIVKAQKPGRAIYETTYGEFDKAWLDTINADEPGDEDIQIHTRDISLQKKSITVKGFDISSLTSFLKMVAEDTYRIKGFVEIDGTTYLVDCVGPLVEVHPFEGQPVNPGVLTVLYGHGLSAVKSIKEARTWFANATVEII